jgi:hypothetical protein
MPIPQHPFHSQWQPIEVDVVGYRLIDTIETATSIPLKLQGILSAYSLQ